MFSSFRFPFNHYLSNHIFSKRLCRPLCVLPLRLWLFRKKGNNISIYNTKYFVWKASSSYKMTQAQLSNDIDEVYLNVQHFFIQEKVSGGRKSSFSGNFHVLILLSFPAVFTFCSCFLGSLLDCRGWTYMPEVAHFTFQRIFFTKSPRDLMARNISWHYAIDLAGSEQATFSFHH